jgi:hypothetical protein
MKRVCGNRVARLVRFSVRRLPGNTGVRITKIGTWDMTTTGGCNRDLRSAASPAPLVTFVAKQKPPLGSVATVHCDLL